MIRLVLLTILSVLPATAGASTLRDGSSPTTAVLVAHPMHTSVTTLTHAANGTLTASIRVFANDIADALRVPSANSAAPLDARTSARIAAYVAERFIIVLSNGRRVAFRWCAPTRNGDLLLLCVTAPSVGTLRGATLVNRILVERFTDQVNIVQVQYAGRRQSFLFTRAEAPKRLP